MKAMEWAALVTWLIVAPLALVLAHGMTMGILPFGLSAMTAGAGATAMIAFVIFGEPDALAWIAVGAAAVTAVSLGFAVYALVNAEPYPDPPATQQSAAEVHAALSSLQ